MIVAAALLLAWRAAAAHDIPNDVKVRAFVKPEGQRLIVLVRVPLEAMREADIPLRGPGYVDLPNADAPLRTAARLWLSDNIEVFENDRRLPAPTLAAARIALASDPSFASYGQALATVRSPPVDPKLDLYWKQQYLDALLEYPIASEKSEFSIDARFARLGLKVMTTLRFLPPGGAERAFEVHGDAGLLRLDPRWHHAALRFVELGFRHILDGTDHLLFIACLVIPFRRLGPLVAIATAFTVAHSITLACAAFGLAPDALWFLPLVETLIAASILYMALENIVGSNPYRRWMLAFAFGLVHGFGFAFALRESLQFAGSHLATALFAFNAGVELGQIAVLLVLVPLLSFAFRYIPERVGTIILSALVAHTAWHWLTERFADLRKFPFPTLDAASWASLLRWAMAALAMACVVGLTNAWVKRRLAHLGAQNTTPS
ncbi:MAG: HupE/UreJ family protein [Usitatibacter sp.]